MVFPFIIAAVNAIGLAITAVTSAVTSVGGALSSFAATVGPRLIAAVETFKPMIETMVKFANTFLQNLSILQPNEKIQDLGERALQAVNQGIKLEDYKDFEKYAETIRKIELDPKASEQRSDTEKLLAGLGVATVGLEKKFNAEPGSLNGVWLLPMANAEYFTPERMQNLASVGRLSNDVLGYLNKTLSGSEARSFEKNLESTLESPQEIDTLYNNLDNACKAWNALSEAIEKRAQEQD